MQKRATSCPGGCRLADQLFLNLRSRDAAVGGGFVNAGVEPGEPGQVSNLAAAQVHATLALAAATALTWSSKDLKVWQPVAGVSPKKE